MFARALSFVSAGLVGILLVGRSLEAQAQPNCVGDACSPPPDTTHAVSVTGGSVVVPQNSSSDTVQFSVLNVGGQTDTYFFSCSAVGGVSCISFSPTSATLLPSRGQMVRVIFSAGTTNGTLTLTASGTASGSGDYSVTVGIPPTVSLVAPVLSSGSRAVVRTRQPIIRALFGAPGASLDTTRTQLKWRSDATVTSLARANHGLLEWEVDSTHWLGVGDSARIDVTACSTQGLCTTITRWAVLPNDNNPVLGFTGVPLEALGRVFSAPFGPGLGVSGAEVETGLAIPAYVSMGTARSAGLVYSTRQSHPRALVPVDLELTWPAGTPDQIKLTLFDGVTKLDSLVLTSPTCATGSTRRCRAVLQADFSASSFSAPTRKWLTVEARVTSVANTQISADSVEVVLVDRRPSPYGAGWWPSAMLKLVGAGNDRVLVGPAGTATVYRGNADTVYVSPPGEFTALVKTAGGWELRPRTTSAKLVFDGSGRLSQALDQNANATTLAYNLGSDQITTITDPVSKQITLGYDGNGKLSTFTDPGSRQSRVSVDPTTNQLTYDSISSPVTRPATARFVYQPYSGTNTVVLTQRIGVLADTTVVTYDSTFRRRPSQVTLPAVDTGGGTARPVITYAAYEGRGYGALVSLDSVYVHLADPRSNWTRSVLNRWGEARKTWDALGTIGRTEYTPEGFVLWSEGKVADSSRVYNSYDALGRLAKTYLFQDATHILRLDSLVYDANHRVIQRIDSRGQVTQFTYETYGHVNRVITPKLDTSQAWYRGDGLPDSVRLARASAARRFGYTAAGKNLLYARDETATTLDSTIVDNLGRDSVSLHKVRTQASIGGWPQWQWQLVQTYYNPAGQVDSIVLLHTDNCSDPCTTAPAWPLASDTLRTERVGYRYDRAGRDSLRLNDRGKGVAYLYDRLGRVVSRRPWADSAAVRDSFVYDLAGNVSKTITRRGDVITTNYDSRNRDSLSIIPRVGTLRKQFGGPLDQLTRMWYDNPVDSIGGVNAELRWGYDQRGRLKADTSYVGTAGQATSYAYDTYERLATTTDPLGTWTTHYETTRGYADTLITPMGDMITYTYDARGRAVGPYISNGAGAALSTVPTWNATGALGTLTNTVATAPSFAPGAWDRHTFPDESSPALAPVWIEQHGSAAALDSLKDSVTYDGWGRVVAWVGFKNAGVAARDTFQFDRTGNLRTGAGVETYDVTTDRLVSQNKAGLPWSFAYDRAGNLTQQQCNHIMCMPASQIWTYGYDALNRLGSVRYNGTLIARYAYDVLGRRIAKRVYSNSTGGTVGYTRFVYHGDAVAFETDSAGNVGLRYTWGTRTDDLLAIQDAAGNHYYVVQDQLHSARGVVQSGGTWIRSLRYGPYGAVVMDTTPGAGPTLRYRWTGREWDQETGLYFFRARYYDPGVRRFIQEDPIGYGGGGNVYAYGGGGPLEGRDPSGMEMSPDMMVCHVCHHIGPVGPAVYLDGAPLGNWGSDFSWDFSGGGFRVSTLDPWAGLDGARADRLRAMAGAPSGGRGLSAIEMAALGDLCNAIDCLRVRISAGGVITWLSGGRPVTLGHTIHVPAGTELPIYVLAHEVFHVVQYEGLGAAGYYLNAATDRVRALFGVDVYTWAFDGRDFWHYRFEQQAQIVEDCFHGNRSGACELSPFWPPGYRP